MSNPIQRETDARLAREIAADLEQREANRQEQRAAYVRTRGEALFAAWLDGWRRKFADDAASEFDLEHAPWTFERVAELRLRQAAPQESYRAQMIERLVALHEQTPRAQPERGPYAHTPGTVLGTSGRQAR